MFKKFSVTKIDIINKTDVLLKVKKTIDIESPKYRFPDYTTCALSLLTDDISEERISNLLNYIGEDPLNEIKEVFYNLRVNDKKRAKRLCFPILSLKYFQSIWDECVMLLSHYRDIEVQDIFVNLLV